MKVICNIKVIFYSRLNTVFSFPSNVTDNRSRGQTDSAPLSINCHITMIVIDEYTLSAIGDEEIQSMTMKLRKKQNGHLQYM